MTTTEAKRAMENHLKVEGGEGDDHDVGIIREIKGNQAFVGWQSGVATWTPIADLSLS